MRFCPTQLVSLLALLLVGCMNSTEKQVVVTVERPSASSLNIYDEAQNLLTQEPIPSGSWQPLNVVIREGGYFHQVQQQYQICSLDRPFCRSSRSAGV